MIYSILQHKEVPVEIIRKYICINDSLGEVIRYDVYETSKNTNFVGYVDLKDTKNGAQVLYIKSEQPNLYKHFGQVADQIEVEHCIKRGIKNPYISSVAAIGTHIIHFKRGKRFINKKINAYLENLTKNLQKGERVMTGFLGYQKMYMPKNMINEIKEKIKISPLLKGIK